MKHTANRWVTQQNKQLQLLAVYYALQLQYVSDLSAAVVIGLL